MQHHNDESSNSSKRLPVKLIFCEYYLFKEDAQRRENYFKTSAGKKALKMMLIDTLEKTKLCLIKNNITILLREKIPCS